MVTGTFAKNFDLRAKEVFFNLNKALLNFWGIDLISETIEGAQKGGGSLLEKSNENKMWVSYRIVCRNDTKLRASQAQLTRSLQRKQTK